MEKKWTVLRDCRGMDNGEIVDAILDERGIDDLDRFLHPTYDDLVPFEEMKNIDKAAEVIMQGVQNKKKFFVHFDSDCDGCCSGAIATKYLWNLGADVKYSINEGKAHGVKDLDLSLLDGIDIMWIVDSIQTEIEPYERILNTGVKKIIISDHHNITKELQEEMENNGNIILVSSYVDYPNPALSGSGTTWKICNYIDWIELSDYSDELAELASTGIIADMCSVGMDSMENRYICSNGFVHTSNPGIKKINGSYEMNSQTVSYGIAPKINSANRVNRNELAMKLFITDDKKEVSAIVKELNNCREEQNAVVDELIPELYAQAEEQLGNKCMYFFLPSEIDAEISGLLGNKLLSEFQVPVFVLRRKIEVDDETGEITSDEYAGSVRATGMENFKIMCDCTGLCGTGGHELAFGFWIDVKNFKQFQEFMEDMLKDVEFVQETTVDIQLDVEQINEDLIKSLKALNKISGTGFPAINVVVAGIADYSVGYMSGGKHLKIETPYLTLIKWNCSDKIELGQELSAVGTLDLSWFGRKLTRQLIMNDYKIEECL